MVMPNSYRGKLARRCERVRPGGAAILQLCNSMEIPYIALVVNNRKEVIQCLIVFRRGHRRP
jgi:hypothetical protein